MAEVCDINAVHSDCTEEVCVLGRSAFISMLLIKSCTRQDNSDMCLLLDTLKSKKRPK